jgi:predicted metal-dependent peptidase
MLNLGKQLTPEQRVSKAVVDIMANPKYTALAGVLMIGERRVETDPAKCPTAYTNGKNEVYGADFIADLNDKQLRFLILHEVYHKLYRHLTTWQHLYKQDAQLANMACDYVINVKIADDNEQDQFATMDGKLECGCFDEKYRGWDSARVFNDLKQQGDNAQGDGQGQGFDEHGWDDAEGMTADEQRDLARDIDEAIRQGALVAGKTGSGGDRDLAELLAPQVDWREVLREFVQTTCAGSDYSTYRRPNRRYLSSGMYMPSGISESVGELIVAVDTSGSIGQRELSVFLSEIKEICDTVHPDAIRLLYWDTEVCADERYVGAECEDLAKSTKPAGGGGTDVRCVTDYITKEEIKAQACIVLTDGYLYGGWGQWNMPVLWTIMDNKNAKPDCGTTVHVKGRDM